MNRRNWLRTLFGAGVATAVGLKAAPAVTKVVPFPAVPDTVYYHGAKFKVLFCKITTPEYTKNVDELHTYNTDLRDILKRNPSRQTICTDPNS
jgi:hypothetical protein